MIRPGENNGVNLANIHQVANAIAANPLSMAENSLQQKRRRRISLLIIERPRRQIPVFRLPIPDFRGKVCGLTG
jgi:hypothetical protein